MRSHVERGNEEVGFSRTFLLLAFLLVGLYVLFFHRLAARDLWSSHEARAGMNGQTLLDRLQDGVPLGETAGLPALYDGRVEMQKPPLYYWLVALAGWVRGGVDAWAVRLPSTLSAVACLGLVLLWAGRRGQWRLGLTAAVVLATAFHFTWLARIGRIDMPLTLTVAAAVLAFVSSLPAGLSRGRRSAYLLAGHLALAAGVWLKGPIGFVLPAAVVAAWCLADGHVSAIWRLSEWGRVGLRLGLWWGLPLVLLLTVPWLVWAHAVTGGEFTRVFLWHHNFERGVGGSRLRSHPFYAYAAFFAGDFLPWTPFFLLAVVACMRRRWVNLPAEARLGLVWFATVFVLLSCARYKRADYLLPAFPGAALFVAGFLTRPARSGGEEDSCASSPELSGSSPFAERKDALSRSERQPSRRTGVMVAVIAGLVVAGWVVRLEWVLPGKEPMRDYKHFARAVRAEAPAPEEVVFFRTEAHALAFHLGRPLTILVQWEHLERRVRAAGVAHVVCPEEIVDEVRHRLPGVRVTRLLANTDRAREHERPLALLEVHSTQVP